MKSLAPGSLKNRVWGSIVMVLVSAMGAVVAGVALGSPADRDPASRPSSGSAAIPAETKTKTEPAMPKPPPTSGPQADNTVPVPPQPVWEHDFLRAPAGTPDRNVWYYELNPEVPGYNDELQGYTDRPGNVRIEPGRGLVIEARKEPYAYAGDPLNRQFGYTSGRIDTRKSFSFEYGRLEAVMRLPKGAGSWPAFWLLSANNVHTAKLNPTDADWQLPRFYAKDGELDIMEHYGHLPGIIEGTAHTYLDTHEGSTKVPDYDKTFHTYGIEIRPDVVTWTVDGKPYHSFKKTSDDPNRWPMGGGNRYYAIFNLAMGGSGGGSIDDAAGPWRLEVQTVRYYP